MKHGAGEAQHPSLSEFEGWYNLGYERPDGIPVLQSREHIPEFDHPEFYELYLAEDDWFDQLVPPPHRSSVDPLADPSMYVISDADDRTLRVCPNFDELTLDVICRIQKEFLGRHPLWRVALIGDDASCGIVVYPDAIRFGNLPLSVDPELALREIASQVIALRDARMLPARQQLEFIEKRVAESIRRIGDRPFEILGVLDNYLGDYDWLTVVVLMPGADDYAVEIDLPPQANRGVMSSCHGFDWDEDLRIINSEDANDSAVFCTRLTMPPASYRGPVTITERDSGKLHTYQLSEEMITRTKPVS